MSWNTRIITILLTVVSAVMLLFAVEVFVTAMNGQLLPLMEESMGKTQEEIESFSPALLSFIFTPLKVFTALLFSFCTVILILTYGPYRKGIKWAAGAIFIPLLAWLISATLIYQSQPSAPWQIWAGLLIITLISLAIHLFRKKN